MTDLQSPLSALCHLLVAPDAPSRVIGRRGGQPVDQAAFRHEAAGWVARFAALPGTDVALHFDDAVSLSAALFAAWHVGKTAWLPGDLRPATLIALEGQVVGLATDATGLQTALALLTPTDPADTSPSGAPAAPLAGGALDPEAEQLVIFTSGSTGAPSAIRKRLRQLFGEIDHLEAAFGARAEGAEIAGLVSAQHIYGLLFRVLWPLATGRVLQARTVPYVESLLEAVTAGPPLVVIASPAHLKRLPAAAPVAPGRVPAVFSSGGPLPDDAVPDCRRLFGLAPIEVYGSSETGGVAWRQRQQDDQRAWTALPGIEWRADEDGVLEIRSSHLPQPAQWTASADRVHLTPDGFELRGRVDRIVKIEGKRVSLAAIEGPLRDSGWLDDLRVFPLDDKGREALAVVAQLNEAGWRALEADGRQALTQVLRERLAGAVDPIALPRRWRFVSALPSTSQGKVTVAALAALFDRRRPQVRILSQGADEARLRLYVDASLPQFDGHFPGHPILPGVAQLDWAVRFGLELLPLPGEFQGIDGLKFQQVIRPGQTVELRLTRRAPLLDFQYTSDHGVHASGKVRVSEPV